MATRHHVPSDTLSQDATIEVFMDWFQSNGGFFDRQVMDIAEFPGSGRGAIALRDIPEGYTLFTLPRTLALSTRTSPLPSLFGLGAWRAHRLHKGWVGLILCMMWEDAWAHESNVMYGVNDNTRTKWGPYLRALPTTFDTPMFWSAEELKELQGTAVIDKIGRDDADRAYLEQLVPAIQTSPTLFPPTHHGKWYTIDAYHRAGSRILSRSFTVNSWTDGGIEEEEVRGGETEAERSDADEAEAEAECPELRDPIEPMDVDDGHPHLLEDTDEERESNSEEGDSDHSDIAMVPMADLLNARWGSENAKLFHELTTLRMVTTRNIRRGEQIFNTYGDLPNSDLLRRYGHVDLVRLDSSSSAPTQDMFEDKVEDNQADIRSLGNPSDVVEIRADLVVDAVKTTNSEFGVRDLLTRIEWWLDEGEDDVFVLSHPKPGSHFSETVPGGLISLIRLLILSEPDFESACSKGKLPKGKLNRADVKDNKGVLDILDKVISQREGMYVGGSVEDDERLVLLTKTLDKRKRHAVIVRLGEKRILKSVKQTVRVMLDRLGSNSGAYESKKDETSSGKKRVVNGTGSDQGHKRARK